MTLIVQQNSAQEQAVVWVWHLAVQNPERLMFADLIEKRSWRCVMILVSSTEERFYRSQRKKRSNYEHNKQMKDLRPVP